MRPTGGERIAALSALASLGSAVALVLVTAAAHWQGIAVTVIGLLVIVIGGWYAVSRRGIRRTVAVLVGFAGVGLVIAGIARAELSGLGVFVVSALAAISIATARIALRRSARALPPPARSRQSVPPAQHPVLIVNPRSGGGKASRYRLVAECRSRGIEPIVLGPGDDLLHLADEAITRGADVIGMAGGDGSQALVATAAMRRDVPHVVVPAGTRNHFALDLGLDPDDVVGALDAFDDGVERRIDLAAVNGRVFVNNASVGVYAKIVQSPEYRDAKRSTAVEMLPDLLGPGAAPLDLRFTGPDGASHPTAHIILVSNDPYQLNVLAGRGSRERMDGGSLGIVAARISGAADAGRFVALAATGRGTRFPGWLEWTARRFRIDSSTPIDIGVDGEALRLDPPLLFETMPRALRVRLPRRVSGRSPAARAVHVLSHSTITGLARLVAGKPGA